ncbi:MAG: response regulator [Spirochaetales bacterium]|nr:response regulator [Spirochaetales bacterium]
MEKKAILCIDDEAIILLAMVQELKRSFGDEFIYERALNGEEAFEVIEDLGREGIHIAFVITDWLMPGMRGDQILDVIREHHPGAKGIMITGQADDEAINRVASNPAVLAVLQKPWKKQDLIQLITKNQG